MWPKHFKSSNTRPHGGPNIHPINGRAQIMVLKTTGNSIVYLTTNIRGMQAQDSINSGKFTILRLFCGLRYAVIHQLNSQETVAPNSKY